MVDCCLCTNPTFVQPAGRLTRVTLCPNRTAGEQHVLCWQCVSNLRTSTLNPGIWGLKCPLCRAECYISHEHFPDTGELNIGDCTMCGETIDEYGPRMGSNINSLCLKCFLRENPETASDMVIDSTYVPDYTFQSINNNGGAESRENDSINVNIPNHSNGLIELSAQDLIAMRAPTTIIHGDLRVEGQIIRGDSAHNEVPEDGPFYFLRTMTEQPTGDFLEMCGRFEFMMNLCRAAWTANELPALVINKMCILFRNFLLKDMPNDETLGRYNDILRKFKEFVSPPKYREFLQDFIVMSTQHFENKYAN